MNRPKNATPRKSAERPYQEQYPRPEILSSSRRATLVGWLTVLLLLVAGAAAGARSLLSVRAPHGIPLGPSTRTPEAVLTLIRTMEPYVPTLHHDSAIERFRWSLHVQPVAMGAEGRMIPIVKGVGASAVHFPRILGQDGDVVWCQLHEVLGVNLKTAGVVRLADIRAANVDMPERWEDARAFGFSRRLTAFSADWQRKYAIDSQSLRATAIPAVRDGNDSPTPDVSRLLSLGALSTSTEWLGLASAEELRSSFVVGSSITPNLRPGERKSVRMLHRGKVGPGYNATKRRLETLAPVSKDAWFNAAFVCAGVDQDPIRLAGPEGFVVIGAQDETSGAKLVVARVDVEGRIIWKLETELDRFALAQILPEERVLTLVGPRPPVAGKLSEPLLVMVDVASGVATTTSLWR